MKNILILLLLPLFLVSGNLKLINGTIKAHTEVLGDTTINPSSSKIGTKLTIRRAITSIKGEIYISAKSLISDNKSRDEHMYKTLKADSYKNISYKINSIKSSNGKYQLIGKLNFGGKIKSLNVNANIIQKGSNISLSSNFSIKVSDYGIKPPKLLFLSVRDKIDISVKLNLKK
ncbi:hypothetical protein MNB_SV-15-303 [hydrothermal vent metagenome]|uniref:Lipid/polyisoprenoid-binding YceI-like domain-containing protein n=1 Tax=hydrothermal vent metagenome TaxID=652676 RepID=A0A1W1EIN6_9ZZZZ